MQHQNLEKIKSLTLQIGGSAGNLIKKIAGGFELLNSAGTTLVNLRTALADGTDQNQVGTFANIRDVVARIDFSFAGASPPSPGITTTTAITGGTVELEADSLYANESTVAPYNWTKKGDALGSVSGIFRDLTVSATTSASTDSTTTITTGSDIKELDVWIETAYDNSAVITFSIGGVTIGSIDATDSAVIGRYKFTPDDFNITSGDVLNIAITNTPTTGALTAKLTWSKDQEA
jgi:hypothetical protein